MVVIVIQALLSLSRRALKGWDSWALAGLSFTAMFFLSIPFPVIIAMAALWGVVMRPEFDAQKHEDHNVNSYIKTIKTALIWIAIWAAPVLLAWASGANFLTEVALFFSKLAVVTFGGAYAVLAYMTQAVVETHGWLTTPQMIDALGLAETTPGPLILVTQFVGHLAGYQEGGVTLALLAGVMTLWVTFTPCFLWIFIGAPYIETLLSRPRLKGALTSISAAVVGVILNLSVWFALHVIFAEVQTTGLGPAPILGSFNALSAAFVGVAALLLLGLRVSMILALTLMAILAGGVHILM